MIRLSCAPATAPLRGRVAVPGDKSIGHRAVMLSAIADGTSRVRGLSGGEDNRRTVAIFRQLGAAIEDDGRGGLVVHGRPLAALRPSDAPLDCGNSGTTMRLLAGLLCGLPGRAVLVGDEYLHRRPMRRVIDPLVRMGARITGAPGAKAGELYPPLELEGGAPLEGTRHESAVASAQVKSALLLAALSARGEVVVVEPGPSRDHTERMLAARGVPTTGDGRAVTLDPRGWDRRLPPMDVDVPGDPSSAAFLAVAAALVPGSDVTVTGICANPTRTGFLDVLRAMGADVALERERVEGGEPVADLRARASRLSGVEIAGDVVVRAIDELPVLAIAAARARGTTTIRDASELRVKESDRIAWMARTLTALGVELEERPDGLVVHGRDGAPLRAARFESAGDHRVAMSAAVAALGADGPSLIDDADNIRTSFPTFVPLLRELGAHIEEDVR